MASSIGAWASWLHRSYRCPSCGTLGMLYLHGGGVVRCAEETCPDSEAMHQHLVALVAEEASAA